MAPFHDRASALVYVRRIINLILVQIQTLADIQHAPPPPDVDEHRPSSAGQRFCVEQSCRQTKPGLNVPDPGETAACGSGQLRKDEALTGRWVGRKFRNLSHGNAQGVSVRILYRLLGRLPHK